MGGGGKKDDKEKKKEEEEETFVVSAPINVKSISPSEAFGTNLPVIKRVRPPSCEL